MSAEKGWIAEPQPPNVPWHRSYAAYRLGQIEKRERERLQEAERQALQQ